MLRSCFLNAGTIALLSLPAAAHQVQIQGTVGATLHIEPNDIPLAGTPTAVWFALTQAGGTIIPLDQCDCTLNLYDGSQTAIATPPLFSVSAEGYREIPGASVTFPEVGTYELVLTGAPLEGTSFTPFELRFEVIVAGHASHPSATATPVPDTASPAAPAANVPATDAIVPETSPPPAASFIQNRVIVGTGAVFAIGILAGIWGIWRRSLGEKS